MEKVYILARVPSKELAGSRPTLWAFDPSALQIDWGVYPEVDSTASLDVFLKDQKPLPKTAETKTIVESCGLVGIRQYDDTTWKGCGFFLCKARGLGHGKPHMKDMVKRLKAKLKKDEIPLFARGALYHWALLSAVGILTRGGELVKEKHFILQDGWIGWLSLDSADMEKMKELADNNPFALALISMGGDKGGWAVSSYYIYHMNEEAKKKTLTAMQKVQAYIGKMYVERFQQQLEHAISKNKVYTRKKRETLAFAANTIYDCYQEIDPSRGVFHDVEFISGPYNVGGSFEDTAIV